MALRLNSPAFEPGQEIPKKFTCDGDDISPPLNWTGAPEGVEAFALIMDDPDAPVGTWVHWVIFNLPARSCSLQEAFPPDSELASGVRQGKNSWGQLGYGGPCPPRGSHRYVFKLYALDTTLSLPKGISKEALLLAVRGHVLAEAQLMGTYERSR